MALSDAAIRRAKGYRFRKFIAPAGLVSVRTQLQSLFERSHFAARPELVEQEDDRCSRDHHRYASRSDVSATDR